MKLILGAAFFASILNAAAQLFLKLGVEDFSFSQIPWFLLLGFFLFVLSSFIVMFALRRVEMSIMFPLMSVTFVWVSLLSMFILGEAITGLQWTGIGIVVAGVALLGGK